MEDFIRIESLDDHIIFDHSSGISKKDILSFVLDGKAFPCIVKQTREKAILITCGCVDVAWTGGDFPVYHIEKGKLEKILNRSN